MASVRSTCGIAIAGMAFACSSSVGATDAGGDGGQDTSVKPHHEAGSDAPRDATSDAHHDAIVVAPHDAGAKTGLTCGALLTCDDACGSSSSCTNGCYAKSTGVAQGLFNALTACIAANCPGDASSSCDEQAATMACISDLGACEDDKTVGPADPDGGGVVTVHMDAGPVLNCGALIACVAACPADAGSCSSACGAEATAEARALQGSLNGCLATACPSVDAGPCTSATSSACQGCIEEAELAIPNVCATPFNACENDRSNSPDAGTTPTVLEDGGTLKTIVSGLIQPASTLLVQGGALYYAQVVSDSMIMRLPLVDGGTPTPVGPGQPAPVSLAIDANNVYAWSVGSFSAGSSRNNGDGTVVEIPLGGGTPVTLSQTTEVFYDSPYLNAIAIDTNNVYWVAGANGTDGKIMRATIGMQDAAPIFTNQLVPEAIATDGTNVYWANWGTFNALGQSNKDGTISQGLVTGGTAKVLASNLAAPSTITIDANNVYWGNLGALGGDNLPSPNTGSVMQVPIGGGTVTTLASAQAIPIGIAVAGGTVYWAAYGFSSPGLILSVKAGGGTVVPLAAGLPDPFAITISGNTLYWANGPQSDGQGTIMSLSPL